MSNSKIVGLIVVILVLAILMGVIIIDAVATNKSTEIAILTDDTLNQDDSVVVELKSNGKGLTNKKILFKFINKKGKVEEYSTYTYSNGKALLKLNDIKPGSYTVNITFEGDDNLNGANASQKLKIEKATAEEPVEYQQTVDERSYKSDDNPVVDSREFVSWDYSPGDHVREYTYANGDVERFIEGGYHTYYDKSEQVEYYTSKDGSGSMYVGN